MRRLQMVSLFLRVVGLYILFFDLFSSLGLMIGSITSSNTVPLAAGTIVVLTGFLKFFISLSFIIFPMKVVRFLTPGSVEERIEEHPIKADELQVILFVTLGVFFFLNSLTGFIGPVLSILQTGISYSNFNDPISILVFYGPYLVQFAAGIWLIFGAKGLMKIVNRLRTAGH